MRSILVVPFLVAASAAAFAGSGCRPAAVRHANARMCDAASSDDPFDMGLLKCAALQATAPTFRRHPSLRPAYGLNALRCAWQASATHEA
jgi:hypothetical protein